jgi:hypothetical protein
MQFSRNRTKLPLKGCGFCDASINGFLRARRKTRSFPASITRVGGCELYRREIVLHQRAAGIILRAFTIPRFLSRNACDKSDSLRDFLSPSTIVFRHSWVANDMSA